MENLVVFQEETVISSDDSPFVLETYGEEVGEWLEDAGEGLDVAQEVFVENADPRSSSNSISDIRGISFVSVGEPDIEHDLSNDVEMMSHHEVISIQNQIGIKSRLTSERSKKRRGRPPKFQISEIGEDGRKWYNCTVCEAKFEDRTELMQHLREHNKDRPFHCKECGKAFKQAAHLKVHVRQHTGEKPFECDICGKGFRQKAIVDQHMRTHTQLRPYACQYPDCDKSFAQKTSLDNHTKSHQTGRLSEAFKRQQEEQKKKSLIAQELVRNKAKANSVAKVVQGLPYGQKKPIHRVLGGALPLGKDKIQTTVVKMTQTQFEEYLQVRKSNPLHVQNEVISKLDQSTKKQQAATGPFLAYVNVNKPILQEERPHFSLLEVLKELANRWNVMGKCEKEKFALISQDSIDENDSTTEDMENVFREEEIPAEQSIEGAVFEIGESSSDIFYQLETEDARLLEPVSQEKSLNQNVFESKIFVLNPTDDECHESLSVFQEVDRSSMLVDNVKLGEANNVLHFENGNVDTAIIFGETGSVDMSLENNTIFSYPSLVGDEGLDVL